MVSLLNNLFPALWEINLLLGFLDAFSNYWKYRPFYILPFWTSSQILPNISTFLRLGLLLPQWLTQLSLFQCWLLEFHNAYCTANWFWISCYFLVPFQHKIIKIATTLYGYSRASWVSLFYSPIFRPFFLTGENKI